MQNKILKNIGYHISAKDLKGEKNLVKRMNRYGLKWVQFFLGNPRTYNLGEPTITAVKKSNLELNYIAHSPYIINIVDDSKSIYQVSINYIVEALMKCDELNIKYYVTHLGSVKKIVKSKEIVEKLKKSCSQILNKAGEIKTKLLLETTSGSRSGTKVGKLNELLKVTSTFDSRLGVCFDTEHAYANGLNLKDLNLKDIEPEIEVVHLNSIPEQVELNSHLDRHGKTSLKNSKKSVRDSLKEISLFFNQKGIPMILERSGREVINSDLEYLSEVFREGK